MALTAAAALPTYAGAAGGRQLRPQHAGRGDEHRLPAELRDDRGVHVGTAESGGQGAVAGRLLLDDRLEHEVAMQRHSARPECGDGVQRRHEPALHVQRTAAVQASVGDVAAERIAAPRTALADGHHVHVPRQGQGAATAGALERGHQVRAGGAAKVGQARSGVGLERCRVDLVELRREAGVRATTSRR
ncbi:MAG: hypothetical protein V9G19_14775 [Tetrasphaera sp.]